MQQSAADGPEPLQYPRGMPEERERSSRFTTTDLIGPTLIFLGCFLLAVAVALPTLVGGALRTISLATDVTTSAPSLTPPQTDRPARILDRCSLATPGARVLDADLTRQQRVLAVRPADAHRVTLQAGTSIRVDHLVVDGRTVDPAAPRPGSEVPVPDGASACTDETIAAVKDRITLDRSSALPDLSAGGSSEIQYDSRRAPIRVPDRRGFTYMFGFDTIDDATPGKATLQYFDVATRRTVPLTVVGDDQVRGHEAVRLRAEIPDTDLHQIRAADGGAAEDGTPPTIITRPASWFTAAGVAIPGDPARPLKATLHHRGTVEMSVDPATGTILDQRITVDEAYRFIDPDPALADAQLTSLAATFRYDATSQRAMARQATGLDAPATVWGRVVPVFAAIAGLALLIAGIVIMHPALNPRPRLAAWWRQRQRRARPDDHDDPPPEDTTPSS